MQTGSFPTYRDKYSNGAKHGTGPYSIIERACESAIIPLGYAVIRGTDADTQAVLPAASFTLANFLGFVVLPNGSKTKKLTDATGTIVYETEESLPIAEFGKFTIKCGSTFTAGTRCYVAHTAGVGQPGELLGSADGVNTVAINATFENSGSADEIAIIHINKQV